MRYRHRMRGAAALAIIGAAGVLAAGAASAQTVGGGDVQDRANGVLTVLAITATPDSTTSSLSIRSGSSGDPRLNQIQTGGAFNVTDRIYLEGFVGAARYDPRFVFSDGAAQRSLPTRWTGLAATGGVGYDFPLTDTLRFRPIANLSVGYVASDLRVARFFVEPGSPADRTLDFLDGGDLWAGGLGASAMLDYELYRDAYEIDVELRYTHLHLEAAPFSSSAVEGSAQAQTAALWSRLRTPTGVALFGRPLRWVFEAAHSEFLGPQRGVLGFDFLTQLGAGVELDTTADAILVTRTRLVGRFVFGDNVQGFSVGLAASF